MDSAEIAKAKERIEKLLRLAQSSNVHESESAKAIAQSLIDKHCLHDYFRYPRPAQTQAIEAPNIVEISLTTTGKLYDWKLNLAKSCAEYNQCVIYSFRDKAYKETIMKTIGYLNDAEKTYTLYKRLAKYVESESERQGISYRNGMVRYLCEKLQASIIHGMSKKSEEIMKYMRQKGYVLPDMKDAYWYRGFDNVKNDEFYVNRIIENANNTTY